MPRHLSQLHKSSRTAHTSNPCAVIPYTTQRGIWSHFHMRFGNHEFADCMQYVHRTPQRNRRNYTRRPTNAPHNSSLSTFLLFPLGLFLVNLPPVQLGPLVVDLPHCSTAAPCCQASSVSTGPAGCRPASGFHWGSSLSTALLSPPGAPRCQAFPI